MLVINIHQCQWWKTDELMALADMQQTPVTNDDDRLCQCS